MLILSIVYFSKSSSLSDYPAITVLSSNGIAFSLSVTWITAQFTLFKPNQDEVVY